MIKRMLTLAAALGLALTLRVSAEQLAASTTNAFKTKTKSVAIFKDGYGFFIREGKARLYDGWAMTDYIPRATAGSFWFYSLEPDSRISTVRSTGRNEIHFDNTAQLLDSLRHKIGVQIKLTTADASAEGELMRVLDDMALVKSGQGCPCGTARRHQDRGGARQPAAAPCRQQEEARRGHGRYGLSSAGNHLGAHLHPGTDRLGHGADHSACDDHQWRRGPARQQDIPGGRRPELLPRGTRSIRSPLTRSASRCSGTCRDWWPEVSRRPCRTHFRPISACMGELTSIPSPLSVPMEGLQEMYFYEADVPEVLIGDVVMSTVLNDTVPYHDLFTWNADGKDVFHYVVLTNKLASPLTTGPVMVLQNGKPLSQDQLLYTPMGAESRVKLTQATDMRTDVTETEIERKEPEKIGDRVFIQVTSEIRLKITNHREKAADVEVTRSVVGKVLSASDDGAIESRPNPDDALNPLSNVKWTTKVDPGKDRVLTYRYLRYVRVPVGRRCGAGDGPTV